MKSLVATFINSKIQKVNTSNTRHRWTKQTHMVLRTNTLKLVCCRSVYSLPLRFHVCHWASVQRLLSYRVNGDRRYFLTVNASLLVKDSDVSIYSQSLEVFLFFSSDWKSRPLHFWDVQTHNCSRNWFVCF